MKHRILPALLITLATGCASPAVGDWVSEERVAGEKNELTLDEDNQGTATIYFYLYGNPLYGDFDLEWREDGDDLSLSLECDGCPDTLFDFDMECQFKDDDNELDCDGDGPFKDYEFVWIRK